MVLSLARTGSVEYISALLKYFNRNNIYLIVNEKSVDKFDYYDETIDTYNGIASFLYGFIKNIKNITLRLNALKKVNSNMIILAPSFHPLNLYISKWSKKANIQFIQTIHDFYTHEDKMNWIIRRLQNKTATHSSHVLFLTQNQRQLAITNGLSENKTFVIPHPLFETKETQNLEYSNKLKFIFAGNIKKYKGLEILASIFKELTNVELTIIGKGKLPSGILSLPNVTVRNSHVSDTELKKTINEHHYLLLPYQKATQSGILSLGLSLQIPMIITRHSGLEEQLSESSAIWCKSDKDSIQKAIEMTINNKDLYLSLKENLKVDKEKKAQALKKAISSFNSYFLLS